MLNFYKTKKMNNKKNLIMKEKRFFQEYPLFIMDKLLSVLSNIHKVISFL